MQYDTRARLLAVEVLLADPEELGNDALETDLYVLRDQLTGTAGAAAYLLGCGRWWQEIFGLTPR